MDGFVMQLMAGYRGHYDVEGDETADRGRRSRSRVHYPLEEDLPQPKMMYDILSALIAVTFGENTDTAYPLNCATLNETSVAGNARYKCSGNEK